jgi:hypothetical protein
MKTGIVQVSYCETIIMHSVSYSVNFSSKSKVFTIFGFSLHGIFFMLVLLIHHHCMVFLQEFEPLIQKPYSIVYLHSAASLQP